MSASFLGGDLSGLPRIRDIERRRISSYDRTGGNKDYIVVPAGETAVIAEMNGAGCVKHIWATIRSSDEWYLRKLVLRAYWDGEKSPSVEVPVGDFFGIGHGVTHNYVSAPLQMSPQDGKGFNCWWPMPYEKGAKITIENQGEKECSVPLGKIINTAGNLFGNRCPITAPPQSSLRIRLPPLTKTDI